MEEASKLIGAGKKHLVMGKAVEAVAALQDACSMLAKKYGDTADECGEAFYWCGVALLDLARMENSVLGNALQGVPDEEEEEEEKPKDSKIESTENIDEKARDELREQVYDAMAEKENKDAENAKGDQSAEAEKSGEAGEEQSVPMEEEDGEAKTGKGEEGADEEKKSNEDGSASTESGEKAEAEESADKGEESAAKPEEAGEEEGGDEAEMEDEEEGDGDAEGQDEGDDTAEEKDNDDEEVGNLQLAWEMLELAKVIYKRKETKDEQLMAAQAHLKLGEISTESGNYTQALEDLQDCLKLQRKHLDSDSRLLAETHYQLGLTYALDCKFSQAIEAFHGSVAVIKSRLDKLQEAIDRSDEGKEMKELQALLPEIQEKVEDATAGLKMTSNEAVKEVLDGGSKPSALSASTVQNGETAASSVIKDSSTSGIGSASGHDSKTPVSDISHLVRKKRRPEESPGQEGVSKKVKQDNVHTKDGDEPQTNGVQEPHANGNDAGQTTSMEVERH